MESRTAEVVSRPAPIRYVRLDWLQECLVSAERRATVREYEECGVLANIVKMGGMYHVSVTRQYSLGSTQIIVGRFSYQSLRMALKSMHYHLRHAYNETVSRKMASLLVDGLLAEDDIPF